MFPTLKLFGVGSIPWSPLARGLLTRSLEKQKASKRGEIDNWMPMYNMAGEWFETIVNRVEELATKKEISMAQIALAWIMNRDGRCLDICVYFQSTDPAHVFLPQLSVPPHSRIYTIYWVRLMVSCFSLLTRLLASTGAIHVKLTAEEMAYLEEPYKPQAIIGHF